MGVSMQDESHSRTLRFPSQAMASKPLDEAGYFGASGVGSTSATNSSRRSERSSKKRVVIEGHTSDEIDKIQGRSSFFLPARKVLCFVLTEPSYHPFPGPGRSGVSVEHYAYKIDGVVWKHRRVRVEGAPTERNVVRATRIEDLETSEIIRDNRWASVLGKITGVLRVAGVLLLLAFLWRASDTTYLHRNEYRAALAALSRALLGRTADVVTPGQPPDLQWISGEGSPTTGEIRPGPPSVIRPELHYHHPNWWEYALVALGLLGVPSFVLAGIHDFRVRSRGLPIVRGRTGDVVEREANTFRSTMRFQLPLVTPPVSVELRAAAIQGTVRPFTTVAVYGRRTKRGVLRASRIEDCETGEIIEGSFTAAVANTIAVIVAIAPVIVIIPLLFPIRIASWLAAALLFVKRLLESRPQAVLFAAIIASACLPVSVWLFKEDSRHGS